MTEVPSLALGSQGADSDPTTWGTAGESPKLQTATLRESGGLLYG